MRPIYFIVLLIVVPLCAQGQEFLFTYGGSGDEEASQMVQLPDGTFIVVGYTNSNSDPNGTPYWTSGSGDKDALVFNINADGDILWAKTYGGANDERLINVVFDGDYLYCVGSTSTWHSESPIVVGENDIFVLKLDIEGDVLWSTYVGESTPPLTNQTNENCWGLTLAPSVMGGVVLLGSSNKQGSSAATISDAVVIYIKADGSYGFGNRISRSGTSGDYGYEISKNKDNELLLSVGVYDDGDRKQCLVRMDMQGNVQGAIRLISDPNDSDPFGANSIFCHPVSNVLYVAGGKGVITNQEPYIFSLDGSDGTSLPPLKHLDNPSTASHRAHLHPRGRDMKGMYITTTDSGTNSNDTDCNIVRLDENLNVVWQKAIGFSYRYDYFRDLVHCNLGTSIIASGGTQAVFGELPTFDILVGRILDNDATPSTLPCEETDIYTESTFTLDNSVTTDITITALTGAWIQPQFLDLDDAQSPLFLSHRSIDLQRRGLSCETTGGTFNKITEDK